MLPLSSNGRSAKALRRNRGVPHALAWLLLLWIGVASNAWADCSGTQTAQVPSGGTVFFNCADSTGGFSQVITPPQHGTVDPNGGTDTNPFGMPYVNNGDGATSDSFTVTDGQGVPVNFVVTIGAASLTITTTSVPSPTYNVSYSQQVQATGGTAPLTFSISSGALPPGITLSSGGLLSGTTVQTGTASFTVRVTDSASHTAQQSFSVNVAEPQITLQPTTVPNGTRGVGYTSTTLSATGGAGPYAFSVSAGSLPNGLSLSPGGVLSGTPTTANTFNFTVRATDVNGISGIASYTVVISAPPLSISTTSLNAMAYGQPTSQQVQATGGTPPYTYTITSGAPPGIVIAGDGTISGTPTSAGVYDIAVHLADAASQTADKTFTVTVATPSLTIAPTSLPAGVATRAYTTTTVTTTGGVAPYTYTLSGTLPSGMTFDGSAGTFSGTPTQSGDFPVSVIVKDSTPNNNNTPATATQNYTLQIAARPTITVAPASVANGTYHQPYSQTFTASGGTGSYTFSATGNLPPGLALGAGGVLSGTPTTAVGGPFNFTVTATDGQGFTGDGNYSIMIAAIAPGKPTGVSATAASGAASDPASAVVSFSAPAENGGSPIAEYVVTSDQGGFTQSGAGSPITVAGLARGTSYRFTVTARNQAGLTGDASDASAAVTPMITDTITFPPPGAQNFGTTPTLTASAASGRQPTFSSTTPQVCTITSGGTLTFVKADPACSITASLGASGPYEAAAPVTRTFAVNAIAPGAPVIGQATTTPVAAGQVTGTASVSFSAPADSGGSTITGYTVTSHPDGITASVGAGATSATVTGLTLGRPYNFTVSATTGSAGAGPDSGTSNTVTPMAGQAITFDDPGSRNFGELVDLHATSTSGLTVSFASQTTNVCEMKSATQIQGIAPGTCTVRASQAGSVAYEVAPAVDRSFTILVPGGAVTITTASLPAPTRGVAYAQTIVAAGGAQPYTFTQSGALPNGLTFNNGTISGTPTQSGSYSIQVTVTDQASQTDSKGYSFTVITPALTFTPASLPVGKVGAAYPATTIAASSGIAPYAYAVASGTLPAGLTLSSGGVLSGTPTGAGSFPITIRATDSFGETGDQAYTVTVGDATPVAVDDAATVGANGNVSVPVTTNDTGGPITSIAVSQQPAHGTATVNGLNAVYTPAHDFFGTDTFKYTGTGPGGTSNAATVTVTVSPGVVPTVTTHKATVLAGKPVTIHAAEGAANGPFTATAVVDAPSSGKVQVQGTDLVYTPAEDASGDITFTYTLSNAFGASQPAQVTVTVNPLPVAPPVSATALQGRDVRVNLSAGARGGPFTGADVVSVSPAHAGATRIESAADGYTLVFNAAPSFTGGTVQIAYTLRNAYATSAPGYVTVTVTPRPDPSKDPEVLGVLSAQADATRRMAVGQISNFQRRLEMLHSGGANGFTNGITIASAGSSRGKDAYADLRSAHDEASRRYLVQPDADSAASTANATSQHGTLPGDVSVWTGGAVNFGKSQVGGSDNGTDFTTSGLSFGVDKQFSDKLAIGAGVGYGHDNSDVGNNGSRSAVDSYNVALYGSYRPTASFYIDALAGYQWLSFDSHRFVTADGNRVTGSRDGKQWFASMSAGYNHVGDDMQFTPYGRLDVARARLDAFTEHGDDVYALDYRGQTVKTTTATVGVLAQWSAKRDYGIWAPQLRAEFGHDMQGSSQAAIRYADMLDGPLYRATLYRQSRNHTLLGAGIVLQTNGGWMLRAEYQNQLDNTSRDNQSILLGVEKKFGP